MFRFGRVFTDTDKLADSKDGQDIIIKVFQHDRAGNHKSVVTQKTNIQQLTVSSVEQTQINLQEK